MTSGVTLLKQVLPAVFIIGIIAVIAIPVVHPLQTGRCRRR